MQVRLLLSVVMSLSCLEVAASSYEAFASDITKTKAYRKNLAKFEAAYDYRKAIPEFAQAVPSDPVAQVKRENAILKILNKRKTQQDLNQLYRAHRDLHENVQRCRILCLLPDICVHKKKYMKRYINNLIKFNALPALVTQLQPTAGLTGIALIKADERNISTINRIARNKEESLQAVLNHPRL